MTSVTFAISLCSCIFIDGIDASEDGVHPCNITTGEKVFSILNGVMSPVAETIRSSGSDRLMWGFVSLAAGVLGYNLTILRTQTRSAASDCMLVLLFLVAKILADLRLLSLPSLGAWLSLARKRGLEKRRASGPEEPVSILESVTIDGQGSPPVSGLGLTSPEKRAAHTAPSPTATRQPFSPLSMNARQSPLRP